MPRKSRKRFLRGLGVDEELERWGREEAYRRLEVELHREWWLRHVWGNEVTGDVSL